MFRLILKYWKWSIWIFPISYLVMIYSELFMSYSVVLSVIRGVTFLILLLFFLLIYTVLSQRYSRFIKSQLSNVLAILSTISIAVFLILLPNGIKNLMLQSAQGEAIGRVDEYDTYRSRRGGPKEIYRFVYEVDGKKMRFNLPHDVCYCDSKLPYELKKEAEIGHKVLVTYHEKFPAIHKVCFLE